MTTTSTKDDQQCIVTEEPARRLENQGQCPDLRTLEEGTGTTVAVPSYEDTDRDVCGGDTTEQDSMVSAEYPTEPEIRQMTASQISMLKMRKPDERALSLMRKAKKSEKRRKDTRVNSRLFNRYRISEASADGSEQLRTAHGHTNRKAGAGIKQLPL